jgi:hypothetical protein
MRKKQIAIIAFAVWLTIISVVMTLAQSIDLGMYFSLSFIGFLFIVELIAPKYIQPNSHRFIWYLIAIGFVIFSAIVVQKVLDILELEIVI